MLMDKAENTGDSVLTPDMRKRVWRAVALTAGRAGAAMGATEPSIPLYPDAVPDIDAHLEVLARLVSNAGPGGSFTPRDVSERVCPTCPHQFPSRYCPLRPHGGCVLYRLATKISAAVAAAMDECEPDSFDAREACHAQDAS
jgi:hypothetical protein